MDDFQYQQPQRYRITNRQRDEEKKRKSGSSGGIPDRWLDYIGVNSWIENTRFIAFKCPLKPEMQKHLPDDRRFTLGDLVERLDDKGKELGLIIDLTNTERYYKRTDIEDAQIEYHKLMTPGHNQIPNETCYQDFAKTVRNFLDRNKNNDKLIGVHCTHGLNRTGYLIVRYMIEEMNFKPEEALEAFNRARGHSMEKYTEDLLRRSAVSCQMQNNSNSVSDSVTNGDQIPWPSLYSSLESMSLDERRSSKYQSKSPHTPASASMQHRENRNEQEHFRTSTIVHDGNQSFRSQGHGRPTYHQSHSINNGFSRQTSVAPRVLNASYNDDQHPIQSASAYFGSGSNVGRGRPMTGDR
ncbi:unnamed protein product [Adineta ricciae]|uniref:Tyrosine specific protein phosphatases domain-containing protein n=1 Tax=Adineta ricciae TaxID=249248 RepID=A0A814EQ59_ADIRI|nr:unnamed protein product [Adineta ricciae]